jgi:hypothetical protein
MIKYIIGTVLPVFIIIIIIIIIIVDSGMRSWFIENIILVQI